jgi:hypothetical protein
MQGSQAEVTRLMECVARSKVNFCRLEWNKAYFSNPKAFFSSVVSVSIILAYKSMSLYCLIVFLLDIFFLAIFVCMTHISYQIVIVPHGLNHRDYVMCICSISRNDRKNKVDQPTNHRARHTDLRRKPFNVKGKTTGTN